MQHLCVKESQGAIRDVDHVGYVFSYTVDHAGYRLSNMVDVGATDLLDRSQMMKILTDLVLPQFIQAQVYHKALKNP